MVNARAPQIPRIAATAGAIAAGNLESARQCSWSRYWRAPQQPQLAELIVEQEQLTAQFTGDVSAFDRLDTLADEMVRTDPDTARTALIAAQIACSTHRFSDARMQIAKAIELGAPSDATQRLSLTVDQATGEHLPAVLAARRARAARPGHWEEKIPLGALLVDLGEFDEAEHTYVEALRTYPDVSPFGPAWASFQLGVLWGECMPDPDPDRAAQWYGAAIDYLPGYVKPRVHLAEIYLDDGRIDDAVTLLVPVAERGDPEVPWRLGDAALAAQCPDKAAPHLAAAHAGFEALLTKHPLAFADHGAEFYLGSGKQPARAFHLAMLNLDNRPTLRAFQLANLTAIAAGEAESAAKLRARADERRKQLNVSHNH